MVGHQMAAAFLAELTIAGFGFLEAPEMLCTLRDFDILRLPECKGIDRGCGPGSAGVAMAIAHSFRNALNFDLYGPAEAFSLVCCHSMISFLTLQKLSGGDVAFALYAR